MKKLILILDLILFISGYVSAQSSTCTSSEAFCGTDVTNFNASVGAGPAEAGAYYGCLYTYPNPAWYYMQIQNSGSITINITESPYHDVDFICWGPFTSPTGPCVTGLTQSNMVDCSYSASGNEYCDIPNGVAGQFYILLITNYSNQATNVSFTQTSGTGSTNCNIIHPGISGDTVCAGQTLNLTTNFPVAGATYAWTGPNGWSSSDMSPVIPNANSTMSGTYTMVMTVNGIPSPPVSCSVLVSPYSSLTANITPANPNSCPGSPSLITANTTGTNPAYTWSTGAHTASISVSPPSSANYTVTVTDLYTCSATASVTVNISTAPVVTVGAAPSTICKGSSTTVTANGAATYSWSNGLGTGNPKTVTPAASVNYTVTGTGSNNCTASAYVHVTVQAPAVTIVSQNNIDTICMGGSSTLIALYPFYTFQWSHGLGTNDTVVVSPTITTTYTVTGTNSNGCTASSTYKITVKGNATINQSGPYCTGDAPVTLTAASLFGTWSGPGITNAAAGTFSPAVVGVGHFIIQYTIGSPCPATDTTVIMVNQTPVSTINPAGPFCSSGASATLTAANSGGTWSGTGITNTTLGTFSPVVAGPGSHVVTYTIPGICPSVSTRTIVVISDDATINPAGPFCTDYPPIQLYAAAPGGTWSGTGITDAVNGIFEPGVAGQGTHTITYTLPSPCPASSQLAIVVNSSDATIYPAGPFCSNAAPVTLTSVGAGGTWTGPGITNSLTGTFDPAVAGPGTHTITHHIGGICHSTSILNITVNAAAPATINPAGPFCSDNPPVNLTAVTPGGTWAGTGITNTTLGTFSPAIAGLGAHKIFYTTTGTCSGTDSIMITVVNTADATINPAGPFCITGAPVNLTAHVAGGVWSGTGITDVNAGTFTPGMAGVGTFIISYSVSGQCAGSDTALVTVVNAGMDATILSAGPFCTSDVPQNLAAMSPGGTWSGVGIIDQATGTFDPAVAGAGDHIINYVISGTCSNSDTITLHVLPAPDATIYPAGPFCSGSPAVTLAAVDAGGIWSGTGITNPATGKFEPFVAGLGTQTIYYKISGPCTAMDSIVIDVIASPDATIHPAGPYCSKEVPVTLYAATPGGIWSGTGITDAVNGTFDPFLAGAGIHTITYALSGQCPTTSHLDIVVNPTPDPTIDPAGPYCINVPPVTLHAATGGGIWHGFGINDSINGIFDPLSAGAGTHTINYSIGGICPASANINIIIDLCTGTADIDNVFEPRIYPNPTNGKITVELPSGERCLLSLYNMLGQEIYQIQLEGKPVEKLDFGNVESGVYFIAIYDGKTIQKHKIIIQH